MDEAGWMRVAGTSEVAEGQVLGVRAGGRDLAVYHLPGGEFRCTDNICSHEFALLSDGWLEDGCIECPLHAGRFDIRTGKGQGAPIDKDIEVFEVRAEGDDLLIRMPAAA